MAQILSDFTGMGEYKNSSTIILDHHKFVTYLPFRRFFSMHYLIHYLRRGRVAMEGEAFAVEPLALREVEEAYTVLVDHNSSKVRVAFVRHHRVLDSALAVSRPKLDEVCP